MKRKTIGLLLCISLVFVWTGCGKDSEAVNSDGVENTGETAEQTAQEDIKHIAVFLKGSDSAETVEKQELFLKNGEEKGYEVAISLAADDSLLQNEQIKAKIEQEVDVVIIEPVDPYGLTEVLEQAQSMEIPVIAYDDLIMDTPSVSYYTTYSYRTMGHMIGEAIKEAKNLEDAVQNQLSYNIEFMMGSQDSLEALFFYNGVMEILQEYFDAGVLVCPSGKNSFDASGILRWDGSQAGIRCKEILETYYQDGKVIDIVCTGFDAAAANAASALEEAGYLPGSDNWPLITGIGCETEAVTAMEQGKQYCSIYMDESVLVETCMKMADACIKGEEPEVNDSVQYDNGVKIVDSNVCEAKLYTSESISKLNNADADTAEEVSGENTEEDLTGTDSGEESGEENTSEGNNLDEALDSMTVEDL